MPALRHRVHEHGVRAMIEVSKKGVAPRQFKDELLAAVLLQVTGGGWTAQQTADAMVLRSAYEEKGSVKYKGVTIRRIES